MFHGEQINSYLLLSCFFVLLIRAKMHLGYCRPFLYLGTWAGCQMSESPWHFWNTCIDLLYSTWAMESNISGGLISRSSIPLWTYTAKDDHPCSVLHKLLTPSAILMLFGSNGWISCTCAERLTIVWKHWMYYTVLHMQHPVCVVCAGSQTHPDGADLLNMCRLSAWCMQSRSDTS